MSEPTLRRKDLNPDPTSEQMYLRATIRRLRGRVRELERRIDALKQPTQSDGSDAAN